MSRETKACRRLICSWSILIISLTSFGIGPDNDRVHRYLDERSLDRLLEVQLFDWLREEKDPVISEQVARKLADIYLTQLAEHIDDPDKKEELVLQSEVLLGMVPLDKLLDLRIELVVQQYQPYESAADLKRVQLLDHESSKVILEALAGIHSKLNQITKASNLHAEQLDRRASRAQGSALEQIDAQYRAALGYHSRSRFYRGWVGYSVSVLGGIVHHEDALKSFGWVLGFEGRLPVLENIDLDLLEYEHVARSMIGVALIKMQQGEFRVARLWLLAVEESAIAPELVSGLASQRILEVTLGERNWIESKQNAIYLNKKEPESLLGIYQARLLVIRAMENRGNRDPGRGGLEGSVELAKLGLERLIELGEIGQILDLLDRFGALPLFESGFVSLYVQGVKELADADESGSNASYAQAGVKLSQAIESADAIRYPDQAGDAALKLAYSEIRQGYSKSALDNLIRYRALLNTDLQREESQWLELIAYDSLVRGGREDLSEPFANLLVSYIRAYPSTDRANKLIVQYALSGYFTDDTILESLVIPSPDDPLAIPARRKLIQLLYKRPELLVASEGGIFEQIQSHAEWLWENEPNLPENVRESRERIAVCRIVLALGFINERPDTEFLSDVIERADGIIDREPSLLSMRSEVEYRRFQLYLHRGNLDQAGELLIDGNVSDVTLRNVALAQLFERVGKRFESDPSFAAAQSVVRVGQELVAETKHVESTQLDIQASLVIEAVARAAYYLGKVHSESLMSAYALELSKSVFRDGVPSQNGILLTAELCEEQGEIGLELECWLRLVNQINWDNDLWHRARFESFRLLLMNDPQRARQAYEQFRAMHPQGLPEPWGGDVRRLFGEQDRGGEP